MGVTRLKVTAVLIQVFSETISIQTHRPKRFISFCNVTQLGSIILLACAMAYANKTMHINYF
jgi:hypothetical protein